MRTAAARPEREARRPPSHRGLDFEELLVERVAGSKFCSWVLFSHGEKVGICELSGSVFFLSGDDGWVTVTVRMGELEENTAHLPSCKEEGV